MSGRVAVPFTANYASEMVELLRGRGAEVWGSDARRYLDFGSGIAVNALGHAPRALARVVYKQMKNIVHTSNLFTTEPSRLLAEEILRYQPFKSRRMQALFFANSGSEANEAALKFAAFHRERDAGGAHYQPRFACFEGAFHGRTLGALSVTPQPRYQRSLAHLVAPPLVLPYRERAALKRLTPAITAVIIEVLQGEGGMHTIDRPFAEALNERCRECNIILIVDEVQTALGRTGTVYASEQVGLEPDIVTLAKPLGGGLPLSATIVTEAVNSTLSLGLHGSTFGGGPIPTAAGRYVWRTLTDRRFLERVAASGRYLNHWLHILAQKHTIIKEVRGMGMLRGLVCDTKIATVERLVAGALERGLIVLRSGSDVLRVAPPLNISRAQITDGCARIADLLEAAQRGNYT